MIVTEREAWLAVLPAMLEELTERWSLRIGSPFDHATCSWVAPVLRADGTPAVLKLAMPHMEGDHEIQGLRFWNGHPTVQLLEADHRLNAMLLDRCQPGHMLRTEPEPQQDVTIATLLGRLWRTSGAPNRPQGFRHLSEMLEDWHHETLAQAERWPDAGLVNEGLRLFSRLPSRRPTTHYSPPTFTLGMSCNPSASPRW